MAISSKNILSPFPPIFFKEGARGSCGLTLTELIIATAVVGIILLGVASTDYAIRKQSATTVDSTSAGLYAKAMVTHIITNAYQAIGTLADKGILTGLAGGSFCIRTKTPPFFPPPVNWACYTVSSGNLYACNKTSAVACTIPSSDNLGKVVSVSPQFVLDNTVGAQKNEFTVTVTVPDPSALTGQRSLTTSVSPPGHRI